MPSKSQDFECSRLSKKDRLRRAVILCSNYTRNLAFYRASLSYPNMFDCHYPTVHFWISNRNNSIDVCVMDWLKLFNDKRGKIHYHTLVKDPESFHIELINQLGINNTKYSKYVEDMRFYRDKFIAHLDEKRDMNIPVQDLAFDSIIFLHNYLIENESFENDLYGLPNKVDDMKACYTYHLNEAHQVYSCLFE